MAGLAGAAAGAAAFGAGAKPRPVPAQQVAPGRPAAATPDWQAIARLYERPEGVIHLEHGNWGQMARPVELARAVHAERLNRDTSLYARGALAADLVAVRARLAGFLGVAPADVALCRNATEGLRALILGYRPLRAGEAVVTADLDYGAMVSFCRALAAARGGRHVTIALPEPATRQGLVDAYAAAIAAHRPVRLLLLTQVSHRTGLVLPIAEILAMARAEGVDCIVDAAHGVGQLAAPVGTLGADFVGLNLHKWVGAPLGTAAIIVRRARLGDIAPDPAADGDTPAGTAALLHLGTLDWAAWLALPAALDLVESMGPTARAARLRALRALWAERLRGLPGLEVLTPADPALHAGITSFRITGRTSVADNRAIARDLLERARIFAVDRDGPARGACVRITPGFATSEDEVEALARALPPLVARWRRA